MNCSSSNLELLRRLRSIEISSRELFTGGIINRFYNEGRNWYAKIGRLIGRAARKSGHCEGLALSPRLGRFKVERERKTYG